MTIALFMFCMTVQDTDYVRKLAFIYVYRTDPLQGRQKKTKSKPKKPKKFTKKKKSNEDDEEDEPMEESDELDEGEEVDYISGSSRSVIVIYSYFVICHVVLLPVLSGLQHFMFCENLKIISKSDESSYFVFGSVICLT